MQLNGEEALIVVDVQNDFVSGSLAISGAEAVIDPINRLAAAFEHVILTQDWHPEGHVSFASAHPGKQHGDLVTVDYGPQRLCRDHCVQGTWGAEFHPGLQVTKSELVLRKGYRRAVDSFSAFYENDGSTVTGLGEYLKARGFRRVFCTGLARYGCVKATAEGAIRDGFSVVMVDDACKGADLGGEADLQAAAALAKLGVVRVDTADVLAGLED